MGTPKQIDLTDPTRNMFGLRPCPKCGDHHCHPTQAVHPTHPNAVLCDDCGWSEPLAPEPPEACVVCGKPAVTEYPPDDWKGEPSCGGAACELRIQAAMDYHHERGG